jgi:DNA-binding transcriptional LysR family regulator
MRLSLRQLQLFCAVARSGTTTAAAEAVALSQSAVSAAINELQQALGTRLFEKAGQRLVLNDAGRAMRPRAQSLLQQAEALEEQFSADGDLGGVQVRLAASSTIGNHLLPPLLAQWAQALPQVCAQVLVGNTADVAQALMRFEADLGFIDAQ